MITYPIGKQPARSYHFATRYPIGLFPHGALRAHSLSASPVFRTFDQELREEISSYGDEGLSPTDSGMTDFKECLKLLRDGYPEESLLRLRRALQMAPKNPFYLSYAGLLTALAEQRFANAEMLCEQALQIRHNHPQLYLNLAQVYERAGRLEDAVHVLQRGLMSTGRDVKIRRALKRCGVRRNPVLSFLHRSHPMNRLLGKWRHRLVGPTRAA